MKKLLLIVAILTLNIFNAQISNAKEFIEFSNLSIKKQKEIVLKSKWKLKFTKKADGDGEVSKFSNLFDSNRIFYLTLRRINASNSVIRDTELEFPAQDYMILSDWISQLTTLGYHFYQSNYDEMTSKGKGYRIIIKMHSDQDGVLNKINVIRTEN